MVELLRHPRVNVTVGHQCQYGLLTTTVKGGQAPAKKPTMFASTSQHMLARLSRKCDRSHAHQELTGGRGAAAAFYPTQLVEQILRGIRDTADAEARQDQGVEDAMLAQSLARAGSLQDTPAAIAPRLKEQELQSKIDHSRVKFRYQDGSSTLLKLRW